MVYNQYCYLGKYLQWFTVNIVIWEICTMVYSQYFYFGKYVQVNIVIALIDLHSVEGVRNEMTSFVGKPRIEHHSAESH